VKKLEKACASAEEMEAAAARVEELGAKRSAAAAALQPFAAEESTPMSSISTGPMALSFWSCLRPRTGHTGLDVPATPRANAHRRLALRQRTRGAHAQFSRRGALRR
jgi:hypothetical protein